MIEDEILEFNYKTPKKTRQGHPIGCCCGICVCDDYVPGQQPRPKWSMGVSSLSAGVSREERKKVSIRIPKIDLPHIVFNSTKRTT